MNGMDKFFPISRPSLGPLESEYVMRAVDSGWISSIGEFITRFEEEFAKFCGCRHAIAVSNGTAAIHLALRALEIGQGDEIIVPDLSFIATANAVLASGAEPVFADIDRETLCLDPADIEGKITPRTKAIMPVHIYGHPADMNAICDVAQRYGLKVIEDAAEAHGATIRSRRVGSLGDCATFSFYANKILTTGEGGMVTTNDPLIAERCRVLRDHAMSKQKRYWHEEPGYNYRMTNLQAAVGCAQIARSAELLRKRAEIFGWYVEQLKGINGISLNRRAPWAEPCYWMVCAEFDQLDEAKRETLMRRLAEAGVDTRPYFYPMSDMPYFEKADTPVAHELYARGITLPTYFDLTKDDVSVICWTVRRIWSELSVVRVLGQPESGFVDVREVLSGR
jgi:perosamine synthetase